MQTGAVAAVSRRPMAAVFICAMVPSLGATNINQVRAWQATIGETDAEHEHDGREPDADSELRFVAAFGVG